MNEQFKISCTLIFLPISRNTVNNDPFSRLHVKKKWQNMLHENNPLRPSIKVNVFVHSSFSVIAMALQIHLDLLVINGNHAPYS